MMESRSPGFQRAPSHHSVRNRRRSRYQQITQHPQITEHESQTDNEYDPLINDRDGEDDSNNYNGVENSECSPNEISFDDNVEENTDRGDEPLIPDLGNGNRCIECVKAIPVFSADEISEGDHVVSCGAIYDQHMIVISRQADDKFEVIEASNTSSRVVIGLTKLFGRKAKILTSVKKFDFQREKICVVEYKERRYSEEETIQRAFDVYDDRKEFKYNLLHNNCEHFATYCVTGERFSVQVTKLRLTWKMFLSRGFVGISDERVRNQKEYEKNIICKKCYEMNEELLSVGVKQISEASHVKKGDIIRFSYWNLSHEAVVLKIIKTRSNSVVCSIAHYAFCGFFSHRTIKEEEFVIHLDGRCSKLEYGEPRYEIYEPQEVVDRACKRLNEKHFAFFSNDSSHYARWCKLKLHRKEEIV